MRNRSRWYVGAGAASVAAASVTALELEQFVVGWPLEVSAGQPFFDIALDLDVYRQAAGIEQLAVLDASGEPMPFYLVTPAAPAASERRLVLGASPLYATQPAAPVAELSVATEERRTNVTVTRPEDAAAEVVAFVVDARAVESTPFALELDWRALQQPFLLDIRVEQSRTLTDWRPVGRASVATLEIAGATVRHGRVPIAAQAGGYYRITWNKNVADWYLQGVTLVTAETARSEPLVTTLEPLEQPRDERGRELDADALYFDAGGALPVSSATLDFGTGNGWLRADVATSHSLEGPWSTVRNAVLFYALDYDGERLASEPLELGRHEARYWRLTGERSALARVALRLEHDQEFLRVAARGVPPYLLAAGTLAEDAGPDPTLAAVWTQLRPAGAALPRAALGERRELGGAAALVAPYEFPWRTALLVSVLAVGVLVVAWMAVRLAREMHDKP